MVFEIKKITVAIVLFLTPGLLFAGLQEDTISFSKQGKVREAIEKYHEYYLQQKKHNLNLLKEIFLGFLRNEDYTKRASQIIISEVFEGKRDRDATVKIFQELLDFPDTKVKINAVKSLILLDYKGKDLLPALREALLKGECLFEAVKCLGSLKYEESLAILEEGIKNVDESIAALSVWGLAEMGGEKSTSLLINGLQSKAIGDEDSLKEELYKMSDDQINEMLRMITAFIVKLEYAEALGKVGGKDAIRALGEALNSQYEEFKQKVLTALGKIALKEETETGGKGEKAAIPYIKFALKDPALKQKAMKILCELGEKEGMDFYKTRLMQDGLEEKLEAASLLAKGGDKRGITAIEIALQSPDEKIREKAIESLKAFGNDALPLLKKASHDPKFYIRTKVIEVANSLGEEGMEIIIGLTQDKRSDVRRAASLTFAGFEKEYTRWKLKRHELVQFKNKDKAIARIKQIMPPLKQVLYQPWGKRTLVPAHQPLRIELAMTLLYLGERETSAPILKNNLFPRNSNNNPQSQESIAYALAYIKDKSCLPIVKDKFFDNVTGKSTKYVEIKTVKALLEMME